MMLCAHKSWASGYTLVELLVVVSIMGLLAVTAVPLLSASRPALIARQAARMLGEDLVAARQAAITRDMDVHVLLNASDTGYAVEPFGIHRKLGHGLALAFSGAEQDEIVFYPDGSASGGTITVSVRGATDRIKVPWPAGPVVVQ